MVSPLPPLFPYNPLSAQWPVWAKKTANKISSFLCSKLSCGYSSHLECNSNSCSWLPSTSELLLTISVSSLSLLQSYSSMLRPFSEHYALSQFWPFVMLCPLFGSLFTYHGFYWADSCSSSRSSPDITFSGKPLLISHFLAMGIMGALPPCSHVISFFPSQHVPPVLSPPVYLFVTPLPKWLLLFTAVGPVPSTGLPYIRWFNKYLLSESWLYHSLGKWPCIRSLWVCFPNCKMGGW